LIDLKKPSFTLLVCNCGSSSLSAQLYRAEKGTLTSVVTCKAHRVATKSTEPSYIEYTHHCDNSRYEQDKSCPVLSSHRDAICLILRHLCSDCGYKIDVAGHRFVNGGTLFHGSEVVTPSSRERLVACLPLASIHNPNSLSVIDACAEHAASTSHPIVQYVVFDTAFHAKLSRAASTYALPPSIRAEGYRKYGFHGLSYQFVTESLISHKIINTEAEGTPSRVVACHLGTGGSSAAGLLGGRTVDTSMGWSALPGLVMSTRCGDLDPGVVLGLVREGKTADEVEKLLSRESGLVGLTGGVTSDLRDAYNVGFGEEGKSRTEEERDACRLAWEVYVHRLVGHIGQLTAQLGGLDVLAFTDDLGFKLPELRQEVCKRFAWLGVKLDEEKNRETVKGKGDLAHDCLAVISSPESKVKVVVVVNDEEIIVARDVFKFIKSD